MTEPQIHTKLILPAHRGQQTPSSANLWASPNLRDIIQGSS